MAYKSHRIFNQLIQVTTKVPDSFRWGLTIWFIYRLTTSIWAALIWKLGLIPSESSIKYYWGIRPIINGWEGALLGVWQRWDTIHYIRIAQYGYYSNDVSAFFPLYPVLGRLLSSYLNIDILFTLIVISNLSLIILLVLLYQFVEEDFNSKIARRTLVFLTIFPTSFFLIAPYPHSLSLLLVVLTYLAAHQSRWILSFISGLFAGLAHSTVLPLILLLGYETYIHWRKANTSYKWPMLITPFGPAFGVMLFFSWRISVGFPSLSVMLEEYWGRILQMPWKTFAEAVHFSGNLSLIITTWINILLITAVIIVMIQGIKFFDPGLNIYMFSTVIYLSLFTTKNEPFASIGRYVLIIFPLFISLSLWARTYRKRMVIFTSGVFIQLILLSAFIMWFWLE